MMIRIHQFFRSFSNGASYARDLMKKCIHSSRKYAHENKKKNSTKLVRVVVYVMVICTVGYTGALPIYKILNSMHNHI